jgi:hypothetical protein
MHNRNTALLLAASATLVTATCAALELDEFVAGWPLEPPPGAEVFDVPLTAEIYAAAPSVGEIAVLDGSGAPLPFFRRGAPAPLTTEQRVTLEASPLYADDPGSAATVGVTTNERGTSVTVTPGAGDARRISGFVLDARAVTTAPSAFDLDWRALPQPFLLDVRIEHSADLRAWRDVGGAAVAALAIGETQVRHARVPVRAVTGGYYRITANRGVEDWYLERATLVTASALTATPQSVRVQPLAADALPPDAEPDALHFDVGGSLPAASVALAFAAEADWLRGDVAGSHSLAGPWTSIADDTLFYKLVFEGRTFTNPPIGVGRRELRYWRVLPSGTPRTSPVELELTFPQEFLRVGARGDGPWWLAAGTLAEEAGPDPTFAAVWAEVAPTPRTVPIATLGAKRDLGGAEARRASRPFPWRTAALWAVLVGGVLVVGGMAVRLAREMKQKPP